MAEINKLFFNGVLYDFTDKRAHQKIDELPAPPTKLSELFDDESHRTVTDEEKTKWSEKLSYERIASVDEIKEYLGI